jgi:ICE2
MNIFIVFSPIILIATYTNLLLSTITPAASTGGSWTWILGVDGAWGGFRTWRWINTFATLGLYTLEMRFGGDMDLEGDGEGITGHWKIE